MEIHRWLDINEAHLIDLNYDGMDWLKYEWINVIDDFEVKFGWRKEFVDAITARHLKLADDKQRYWQGINTRKKNFFWAWPIHHIISESVGIFEIACQEVVGFFLEIFWEHITLNNGKWCSKLGVSEQVRVLWK